jgi:hypothetical protein
MKPVNKRIRELGPNVALAFASILMLLLGSEALLKLVVPVVYRPQVTRVHPVLGWTHAPSASVTGELEGSTLRVSYNQHGYRIPEHTFDNPDGRQRVVILGDSYVDGAEVDDRDVHTVLLQQRMPDAEVINAGVYGYSTAQALITLEEVGLRYGPDLVVLLTVENDFFDNTRNFAYFGPAPRFRLDADSLILEPATGTLAMETFRATNLPVPWVMPYLHRHSTVYYLLNHHIYQRIIGTRIEAIMASQVNAVSPDDRVELYRRIVVRMARTAERAGADFVVFFAYLRGEVRRNDASPRAELARRLTDDGVAVVDLFDELREAELSSPASLWYELDSHWNPLGHRTAAELMRPRIEEILARRRTLP